MTTRQAVDFHVHHPMPAPSYWQTNTYWCNPTALTDCAQCHIGEWPRGGLGSKWSETSQWYLAGAAGMSHIQAFFIEDLLRAGGLLAPDEMPGNWFSQNLEQYRNSHFDYRTWMFASANPDDWAATFDDMVAFVGDVVNGRWEGLEARPVILTWWHTRVVVGVNGDAVYLNDPAGGSFAATSWTALKQNVIDYASTLEPGDLRKAGLATFVFLAPMRPAIERQGALWLLEAQSRWLQGAVSLRRASGEISSYWHWSGHDGHHDGYYFDDLTASDLLSTPALAADPRFGRAWNPAPGDTLEYQYYVQNLTWQALRYDIDVTLHRGEDPSRFDWLGNAVAVNTDTVLVPARSESGTGTSHVGPLVGQIAIGSDQIRGGGVHTLRVRVSAGGVLQDTKYVCLNLCG